MKKKLKGENYAEGSGRKRKGEKKYDMLFWPFLKGNGLYPFHAGGRAREGVRGFQEPRKKRVEKKRGKRLKSYFR